ncbi:uncharacterized protein METZ01_LOCUS182051, partial [marine metagenome]
EQQNSRRSIADATGAFRRDDLVLRLLRLLHLRHAEEPDSTAVRV